MLIAIIGDKGSGKSLTAVRLIVDKPNVFAFTNFSVMNIKHAQRLKFTDIIEEKLLVIGKKEKIVKDINWQFWRDVRKEHPYFCIFLDEIHNIAHARRGMSSTSVLLSKWISQIRKILADSEHNHLYIISQEARKIDVDFRDLLDMIIKCQAIIKGKGKDKRHYVKLSFYDNINDYAQNIKRRTSIIFRAEKYYKYYDTREFISFGDDEYI
jgi:adenylate kinase family enzyme